MEIETLAQNISLIKKSLMCATLVAATKTIDIEVIERLPELGIQYVGENRVQELLGKYKVIDGLEWQFIGALQTNKVKYIIDKVTLIQSVDRLALAKEIDIQSKKIHKVMDVLIEINIGREENKSGVILENLKDLYDYCLKLANIKVVGFMSVLPKNAPESLYQEMKVIFNEYKKVDKNIEIFSLGMSGDYNIALNYGSNMVRLGTALFGRRA